MRKGNKRTVNSQSPPCRLPSLGYFCLGADGWPTIGILDVEGDVLSDLGLHRFTLVDETTAEMIRKATEQLDAVDSKGIFL